MVKQLEGDVPDKKRPKTAGSADGIDVPVGGAATTAAPIGPLERDAEMAVVSASAPAAAGPKEKGKGKGRGGTEGRSGLGMREMEKMKANSVIIHLRKKIIKS